MIELVPCVSCQQPIDVQLAACPFCAAASDAESLPPGRPIRMRRLATLVFQALLVSSMMAIGCGGDDDDDDGGAGAPTGGRPAAGATATGGTAVFGGSGGTTATAGRPGSGAGTAGR